MMEMPVLPKVAAKKVVPRDDRTKRRKHVSSQVEKTKGGEQAGRDKGATLAEGDRDA